MASGHVNRAKRPNTWPHRPSLQREDFSCQPGAVHTWHFSDVTAGLRNVCCWGKSGSRDCVTRLPSLTQSGPCTVRKLIRSFRCFPGPRVRRPFPYSPRLRNASGASASISQYPNAANVPSINGLLGLRYRPHQIECESGRLDASGCPSPNTWRWPLIVSMYSRTRAMRPSRHSKMKQ